MKLTEKSYVEKKVQNDTLVKAIDLTAKLLKGEDVDEDSIPKLHSREELLNIYNAFKKAILLLENIIV